MTRTAAQPKFLLLTARCHTGRNPPIEACTLPSFFFSNQMFVCISSLLNLRVSPGHTTLCTCRDGILQGQGHVSELVWSKSTTHSFTASHLIAPSTSWTGTLAPSTPEKLAFRTAIPALLATRQGSTASKLLGPHEVSPGTVLSMFVLSSCR